MRAEIARIQRKLGVATLYVTHDQVEAMTMGDRVAVLRDGLLQQCDSPQVLYDAPKNLFVAGFIGSPAMNLFAARLEEGASAVLMGSQRIELADDVHAARPSLRSYANRPIVLGIRPEDLLLARNETESLGATAVEGDVELVEALGSELLVHFTTDAQRVEDPSVKNADAEALSSGMLSREGGIARVGSRSQVTAGKTARFYLDPLRLHFFDAEMGHAIV
jgi:multiple sugar transport system ATP-binding protein